MSGVIGGDVGGVGDPGVAVESCGLAGGFGADSALGVVDDDQASQGWSGSGASSGMYLGLPSSFVTGRPSGSSSISTGCTVPE